MSVDVPPCQSHNLCERDPRVSAQFRGTAYHGSDYNSWTGGLLSTVVMKSAVCTRTVVCATRFSLDGRWFIGCAERDSPNRSVAGQINHGIARIDKHVLLVLVLLRGCI
jgi:hypothetical protein